MNNESEVRNKSSEARLKGKLLRKITGIELIKHVFN